MLALLHHIPTPAVDTISAFEMTFDPVVVIIMGIEFSVLIDNPVTLLTLYCNCVLLFFQSNYSLNSLKFWQREIAWRRVYSS